MQFTLALQAEALALTGPSDNDSLNASTELKNKLADQLAQAAQTRYTILAGLGHSADKAGLDAAVAAYTPLQDVCEALYGHSRQAQELNTANGTVIGIHLEHNQRAIDTLHQLIGANNLYDASGRTKTPPSGGKKSIKAG